MNTWRFADRSTIFEGVIASTISDVLWTGEGDPQRLRGNYGSPNTFLVMGVPALHGRYYVPDDGRADAAPVAVLGYKFWQRQFGGDPSVVGRELRLNDKVRTIVGVMPKRFMWRGADVYLPVTFERGRAIEGVRDVHVLGRLKAGVNEAQAEADLKPIVQDLVQTAPTRFPKTWRVSLLSFKETFPSSIRNDLWVLFGAVGPAVADRVRQRLEPAAVESRGPAARDGRALSTWWRPLAARPAAPYRERHSRRRRCHRWNGARLRRVEHHPHARAAGYDSRRVRGRGQSAGTRIHAARVVRDEPDFRSRAGAAHLFEGLDEPAADERQEYTGGKTQALLRKTLVVGAVALSVMLLVGASLMIRSVIAVTGVSLGFEPERILTLRVPLPERKYPDPARRALFFDELLRGVAAVPGVTAAAVSTSIHPFTNQGWPVEVPGATNNGSPLVMHQVSAGYVRVLGIALLKGREISDSDVSGRRQVALVNQAFERAKLNGADAVGRVVRIPRLTEAPINSTDASVEIVGVVRDTLNDGLMDAVVPEIYVPSSLLGAANRVFVQTAGDPVAVTRAVVEQVYKLDRDQPVTDVRTVQSFLNEFVYAGPRFNLVLLSVFAVLGLTLAVVGVYGVMSHTVSQQTREIGVRIALGADPGSVGRLVVKSGAILLLSGIALGLVGSVFAGRLLAQQIWNVSAFDPISFLAASGVLFVAGLQACAWPAWRATRTQPIVALRQD